MQHGYSQAGVVNAPARLIYTAGQGGADAKGNISSDFKEQVDQAFTNLKLALEAAGASMSDVVNINVFIVDHSMERLDIFEAAAKAAFNNGPFPASTLIPVPKLALDSMIFEINAVAVTAKQP